MRKELGEVEAKIANVLEAIESGLMSSSIQTRLAELEKRKEVILAELLLLTTKRKALRQEPIEVEDAEEAFRRFSTLFRKATSEEKRQLTDLLLAEATVLPGKQVQFEFHVPSGLSYVVQNERFGGAEGIRTPDFPSRLGRTLSRWLPRGRGGSLVERRGFEPLTSSVRGMRSPS